MAVLDPRLTELIETLAAAELDWLAFELVDGVRRGVEPEETADTLEVARAEARAKRPPPERLAAEARPVTSSPLIGDDQVEWAGRYVIARIDDALAALAASLDNLDALVDASEAADVAKADQDAAPMLVLEDLETPRKADRASVERARGDVGALRVAVERWSNQARTASSS